MTQKMHQQPKTLNVLKYALIFLEGNMDKMDENVKEFQQRNENPEKESMGIIESKKHNTVEFQ